MAESLIGLGYKGLKKDYNESEQLNAQELFNKKIWRVGDVARFLGCTIGHVYNLASDEKIPKRKKNGFLFFVPEEILNWILEGDQK
jgi:predicted DNA-binding transcriptional regulator AlpA